MTEFPPVVIEREFEASIERVFRAWTDPTLLVRWFRSSPETVVHSFEVDLRVGGEYRVTIGDPKDPWVAFGKYTEISAPNVIAFTWIWEAATMELNETLVRIELEPVGPNTKLRLTHSGFSSEQSSFAHDKGWNGCLSSLYDFLHD